MLDIAICDDDSKITWELEERLNQLGKLYRVELDIDAYSDGEEIVEAVYQGKHFDLIYMDIEMSHVNGLEAAKRIREIDRAVQLVYVTGYDRYMKEAFYAAPIGYLGKPIDRGELQKTFCHVLRLVGDQDQYYRFRYEKVNYKVLIKDILYFESHNRKTEIVTAARCFVMYKRMETVEQEIKSRQVHFIRIHKSFLINYRHVVKFTYENVEMTDGKKLPISRSRKTEVKCDLIRVYMELE